MIFQNDSGAIYPSVSQAPRNGDGTALTMIVLEDQMVQMNFTITKNCPETWTNESVGFSTLGSNVVKLVVDQHMQTKWVREDLVFYPILSYYPSTFFSNLPFSAFVFSYPMPQLFYIARCPLVCSCLLLTLSHPIPFISFLLIFSCQPSFIPQLQSSPEVTH